MYPHNLLTSIFLLVLATTPTHATFCTCGDGTEIDPQSELPWVLECCDEADDVYHRHWELSEDQKVCQTLWDKGSFDDAFRFSACCERLSGHFGHCEMVGF